MGCILWDVDGTLLDFSRSERYGITKCLNDIGVSATEEMLARYSVINDARWKKLECGELTKEQVMEGRFQQFFSEYGIACPDIPGFNAEYQQALGAVYFYRDRSLELCKKLKDMGWRQYIVTNGSAAAQKNKLRLAGFLPLMDGLFISESIGVPKPAREFFDAIWKQGVAKEESVIIGDSLTSDMRGGNQAGIPCIWYNPGRKTNTTAVRVDYEIQNLWDVLPVLRQLSER